MVEGWPFLGEEGTGCMACFTALGECQGKKGLNASVKETQKRRRSRLKTQKTKEMRLGNAIFVTEKIQKLVQKSSFTRKTHTHLKNTISLTTLILSSLTTSLG